MTQPDELTALRAAVEICDENNGGADDVAIDKRMGADPEFVKMVLPPLIAKYFEQAQPGDDGIAAVHGPIVVAHRFVSS